MTKCDDDIFDFTLQFFAEAVMLIPPEDRVDLLNRFSLGIAELQQHISESCRCCIYSISQK